MQEAHDAYAALRNPNYRRLLLGSLLASAGNEMQSVAIGWELYQRTGSATALGLVGLVQFLPVFLLSLPAGQAADRFDRKRLVVASQLGMALASLGLTSLSFWHGPLPLFYVCLLCSGICQAFNFPAPRPIRRGPSRVGVRGLVFTPGETSSSRRSRRLRSPSRR